MENKSKEELKRIKQLNRSLIKVQRGTAQAFGVVSIQPEHAVFYQGNSRFVKIYTIKAGVMSADDARILIRQIGNMAGCRFRITSFVKGGNRQGTMRFLSLFVLAPDYATAHSVFDEFEQKVKLDISIRMSGAKIDACSLDHALMFMQMNFIGQLKRFDAGKSLKKGEDWGKLMIPTMDVEDGRLILHSNEFVCSCYFGKDFYEDVKDYKEMLLLSNYDFYSCIDVQQLDEDEKALLNKILEQKYTTHIEDEGSQILYNLSYLLFVSSASAAVHEELEKRIMELSRENGLLLESCSGIQMQAYLSMCTFGLRDCRFMRNVSEDIVSNLFV